MVLTFIKIEVKFGTREAEVLNSFTMK